MKILSVIVPCYNSEGYMDRCLDSVLTGGDDVEIVIVDDGSTDRTAEIADDYASRYPSMPRCAANSESGPKPKKPTRKLVEMI